MTDKRRERIAPPPLGGSSLLAAFAVLALTVFALLSLATVRADARLGDAAVKAVEDYYAADCQAQEILARLRCGGSVPDGVKLTAARRAGQNETIYSYAVPISDVQELQAEVLAGPDGRYEILRWQAVRTGAWAPDDRLELWDGTPF